MERTELTFEGGTRTLLGFSIAFVIVFAVFAPLEEFVSQLSTWVWYLQEIVLFLVIAGITLSFVRLDGIHLRDIGFSGRGESPYGVGFA